MRSDMSKVLVLRGRHGGCWHKPSKRRRRGEPERKREPMSRGRGSKALGENLAPLRRFLLSRVGRPFDDVFAELSQHINMSNAVQRHIMEHLWDFVERYPLFIDDVPHRRSTRGAIPLYLHRWRCVHVCPQGILRKNPEPPRRRRPPSLRR